MSDINGLQEMIHNGCYANCDDASQHRGNMSNINTVLRERQDIEAVAFHNDWEGGASRLEDPSRGHPGGKVRATD